MRQSRHDVADLPTQFEERLPKLEVLASVVVEAAREGLSDIPNVDRIYGRAKTTQSFLEKARRKSEQYEEPLEDIEDQVGLRVLVFLESDIDPVVERLRELFTPVEDFRHEPPRDEEFGYLTHHVVFAISDHHKPVGWDDLSPMAKTFEAQVRTLFMHAYAEPQHDFAYKSAGELQGDIRRQLAWIAASAWGADRAYDQVFEAVRKTANEQEEE